MATNASWIERGLHHPAVANADQMDGDKEERKDVNYL